MTAPPLLISKISAQDLVRRSPTGLCGGRAQRGHVGATNPGLVFDVVYWICKPDLVLIHANPPSRRFIGPSKAAKFWNVPSSQNPYHPWPCAGAIGRSRTAVWHFFASGQRRHRPSKNGTGLVSCIRRPALAVKKNGHPPYVNCVH